MASGSILHLPSNVLAIITSNLDLCDICTLSITGNKLFSSKLRNKGVESVCLRSYISIGHITMKPPQCTLTDGPCQCYVSSLKNLGPFRHLKLTLAPKMGCWKQKPDQFFSALGSSLESLFLEINENITAWFSRISLDMNDSMPHLKELKIKDVQFQPYRRPLEKLCFSSLLPSKLAVLLLPPVIIINRISELPKTLKTMNSYLPWQDFDMTDPAVPQLERLCLYADQLELPVHHNIKLSSSLTRLEIRRDRNFDTDPQEAKILGEVLATIPKLGNQNLTRVHISDFDRVPFDLIPSSVTHIKITNSWYRGKHADIDSLPKQVKIFEFRTVGPPPRITGLPSTLKVLKIPFLDVSSYPVTVPEDTEELIMNRWPVDDNGLGRSLKRLIVRRISVPRLMPGMNNLTFIHFEIEKKLTGFDWVPRSIRHLRIETTQTDPKLLEQLSNLPKLRILEIQQIPYYNQAIAVNNALVWETAMPKLPKNISHLRLDFARFSSFSPGIAWPNNLTSLELPFWDIPLGEVRLLPHNLQFLRCRALTIQKDASPSSLLINLSKTHKKLEVLGNLRYTRDDLLDDGLFF